jgi:hypothetical protein
MDPKGPEYVTSDREVVSLRIVDIEKNPLQPTTRTTNKGLSELTRNVLQSNRIDTIAVATLDGRYILVDGHRRAEVAKGLGKERIDCTLYPVANIEEAKNLFVLFNQGSRPFRGANYLTMYAKSGRTAEERRKKYLDNPAVRSFRSKIEQFIDVFGEQRAVELGLAEKTSPDCVEQIFRFYVIADQYKSSAPILFDKRKLGEWMLRHGAVRWLRSVNEQASKDRDSYRKRLALIKLVITLVEKDMSEEELEAEKKAKSEKRQAATAHHDSLLRG